MPSFFRSKSNNIITIPAFAERSSPASTPSVSSSSSSSSLNDMVESKAPPFPQCWGHRGASAAFPENTLASFEAAIRDGAEGIESDVHITSDSIVLMHHDTHLERTTDGTGLIFRQPYYGTLDQVQTKKSPQQKIPTFEETIELLMKPENSHVVLNIDCKVDNDPNVLFDLIHKIVSNHPDYETKLAPRLVLGLWHPKYIEPAKRIVPYMRRIHIGVSPALARKYFWEGCEGFSINFPALVNGDGDLFRKQCKAAGKNLMVWTVNKRSEMIQATKWGCKAVLTDKTATFLSLREQMTADWDGVSKENTWLFGWSSVWYWSITNLMQSAWEEYLLTKAGGSMSSHPAFKITTKA